MPRKPQNPQKQDAGNVSRRDCFETPRYATEIIIPFLKIAGISRVWECAAGNGRMVNVLEDHFYVLDTDLEYGEDFLNITLLNFGELHDSIVTNPPFSLKFKFIDMALELGYPFAFLIPADYCGKIGKYMQMGCEKVVPTRRIDYLTPNMLDRINLDRVVGQEYNSLEDVPVKTLRAYSSSYFHSMWLTKGLHIGNSETWVELTNDDKNRIF